MRIAKRRASAESLAESALLPVSLFVTLVTFLVILTLAVRPALSLGTNMELLASTRRVPQGVDPINNGRWLSSEENKVTSAYAGSSIIAPVPVNTLTKQSPSSRRIIYANFGGVWLTEPIRPNEQRLSLPSVRILRIEGFHPSIITDPGSLEYEE